MLAQNSQGIVVGLLEVHLQVFTISVVLFFNVLCLVCQHWDLGHLFSDQFFVEVDVEKVETCVECLDLVRTCV